MSRIQIHIWSQTCSIWFISGLWSGQSMTRTSHCAGEKQSCHVLLGAWHCRGHMQSFVQTRPLPREAYYRREAGGSVGSWVVHCSPPVDSSRHGGWHVIPWRRATVTIHGLDAYIYQRRTRAWPSLRNSMERSSPLKTQYLQVPLSVHSLLHTTVSPVIQSQSETSGGTPRLLCVAHNVSVASQNFAGASLRHARHSCYFFSRKS